MDCKLHRGEITLNLPEAKNEILAKAPELSSKHTFLYFLKTNEHSITLSSG
jgi:hypothetical protein